MTKRTHKAFAVPVLLSAMLPVMQANAAGFQVSEHSAAGLGRAFAGEAAMASDASVIARNPAGMSKLDSTTITLVGSYIAPEVKLQDKFGSSDGSNSVANEAFVPAGYIVMPVNDKWAVGFGAFTNFGFTTNVGKNSLLTGQARESEIVTMNLNASLSYQMSDRLSFGAGVNAVRTEARLLRTLPSVDAPLLDMEGDDWGYGWNIGMMFDLTPATRLGVSYRSQVNQTLEGKPTTGLYRGDASVDLSLPAMSEFSVNHQLTDTVSLQASWQRTFWSSFDEINIKVVNGISPAVEPQNWKDADRYSLGATWQFSNQLALRAGVAKDRSPIPHAENRYFSIPDTDRMWYSIGASYKLNDNHSFDAGYAFVKADDADIYHNTNTVQGKVVDSSVNIFSLQYNYRF